LTDSKGYGLEKDIKTEILFVLQGMAIDHVCKNGSNQYGTTPAGKNHLLSYIENADFIGKYTPLRTETEERILKAYMKGYFAITGMTENSGQMPKKLAIQHMSDAPEFIARVINSNQDSDLEYFYLKSIITNLIIRETKNLHPSDLEIGDRLLLVIERVQRAYGWNPSTKSWTNPNIHTTDLNQFVADTQAYWHYYESAFDQQVFLYDFANNRVSTSNQLGNIMYNYMMIGSTQSGGYFTTIWKDGKPITIWTTYQAQYQSDFGTFFVQGDSTTHEYNP